MSVFRRALATVATGSTALAGAAVIGVTAAQAATVTPTSLSATTPHQVTYEQPAKVAGDLTSTVTHKGLSGLIVQLQERRRSAVK
ncbi:MAG TPA: hypothetical protein VF482_02205 [Trebonia sp.]